MSLIYGIYTRGGKAMNTLRGLCAELGCTAPEKIDEYVRRFYGGDIPRLCDMDRLVRWYDMDIPGVRALLRLYIEEFTALFTSNGLYRVYASVPCPTIIPAALNSTGKVSVHTAEFCAMITLQGILGQPPPSSGHCWNSRCAMLENRRGFVEAGIIPRPQLMWSFGLLCDECCKTDELIHDCDGVGQMNSFCAKPYDAMRFVRYEEELRTSLEYICVQSGAALPQTKGIRDTTNKAAILAAAICCSNASATRPPLKAGTVALIQTSQLMAFQDMSELVDALEDIYRNMRHIDRAGAMEKLYTYYIPPCIPELGAVYADNGICLVGSAAFITCPVQCMHAKDIAGMAAASWDASILSRSSTDYVRETARTIKKYNCMGYLNGMFGFDRWLGTAHRLTDGEIARLTGKPVFQCSTDFWGRGFNLSKIETLAETMAYLLRAGR